MTVFWIRLENRLSEVNLWQSTVESALCRVHGSRAGLCIYEELVKLADVLQLDL